MGVHYKVYTYRSEDGGFAGVVDSVADTCKMIHAKATSQLDTGKIMTLFTKTMLFTIQWIDR